MSELGSDKKRDTQCVRPFWMVAAPYSDGIFHYAVCLPRLFLSDGDGIFAHEAGSRQELVHQIFILKLTIILCPVVYAIPWLYAHKGCMLACRAPDAHSRCLDVERYHGLVVIAQQFDVPELAAVEDNGVVGKRFFCERPYAVLCLHLVVALGQTAPTLP